MKLSMEKPKFSQGIALVADRRTATLFRLAGMRNLYPIDRYDEIEKCFSKVSENPNFIIILVTERIANKIQDLIDRIAENKYPLVIPIPSLEGSLKVKIDLINKLIKSKVGIDFKL